MVLPSWSLRFQKQKLKTNYKKTFNIHLRHIVIKLQCIEHGLEKDLSKGSYFATERFAKVFKTNSA